MRSSIVLNVFKKNRRPLFEHVQVRLRVTWVAPRVHLVLIHGGAAVRRVSPELGGITVRRIVVGLAALLTGALLVPAQADASFGRNVRFATFNASLNRASAGQLMSDLSTPGNAQAQKVAEVVQRNRADVQLINEFDYVPGNAAADAFRRNYLRIGQNGAPPIDYPYAYTAPSNTGVPTGFDLDHSGTVGGGNDAQGFGLFEGQYGMLVLSKYPIYLAHVRTFQHFLWKDMPGALLPDDPATPAPRDWYSPAVLDVLRLPSKSHWDLPLKIGR